MNYPIEFKIPDEYAPSLITITENITSDIPVFRQDTGGKIHRGRDINIDDFYVLRLAYDAAGSSYGNSTIGVQLVVVVLDTNILFISIQINAHTVPSIFMNDIRLSINNVGIRDIPEEAILHQRAGQYWFSIAIELRKPMTTEDFPIIIL